MKLSSVFTLVLVTKQKPILRQLIVTLLLFGLLLPMSRADANEVFLQYNNLTLNAELELAEGKTLADSVILITHGGLAHRDMENLRYLRTELRDRGYNILAINLSLGIDNRHGMYDCHDTHHHTNDNAVAEIDTWLNWLDKQGTRNVILLGHSRGGAQTALYAAERNHRLVKSVILLAPATKENGHAGYQKRYGLSPDAAVKQAQTLIDDGLGDRTVSHVNIMRCRDTIATAKSFLSYYLPDPRLDTPYLLPFIKTPTLIIVAGDDEVVVDLDNKIAPMIDGKHIQMKIINSSDHLFRDLNTDEAVDAIIPFLKGNAEL